jgi:hypothetical protein
MPWFFPNAKDGDLEKLNLWGSTTMYPGGVVYDGWNADPADIRAKGGQWVSDTQVADIATAQSNAQGPQGPAGASKLGSGTSGTPGALNGSSRTTDALLGEFPWLAQIGFKPSDLQAWAAEGIQGDELVAKVRSTDQWKARFPGMNRTDGSMRMNEAQYFATEDNYRQLLTQYSKAADYTTPASLKGLFDGEIDPNELKTRLDTWDTVKRGSQDIKDAFYVYAGRKLTDDELYMAVVDPIAEQKLNAEYNARVVSQPLDYQTWITRATEAGLNRVASNLQNLQDQGYVTGAAVDQMRNLDPTFARTMADALFHGGDPNGGVPLQLNELMHSFEYAMIGSAASANGLQLPDKDRLEAMRQAGIDRAKALSGYSAFAQNAGQISASVQRLNTGATFGQSEFEKAQFLSDASSQALLAKGQSLEKSLGENAGVAQQSMKDGRLAQRGLTY